MRIAFIGTRGVPARYSGFETFVEETGALLAERGHEVTVYCRRHHSGGAITEHRGMKLIHLGGIATKHLDTISHTLVASLHAAVTGYDVAIMCISGNSPLAVPLRLAGVRVILNVDGSDWRRAKWGSLARAYIRASEWLATRVPHVTVTDCRTMQAYYRTTFGRDTVCIGYGAHMPRPATTDTLQRLGLRPRGYILLVGRLVPENRVDHLVDAYEAMSCGLDCVVVGDAPYAEKYISGLKARGPHVTFPGYVFGEGYRELMHHAYVVVLCSEVGGAHPVLLEAMAAGNCVVVNDTPANREVVGDAGVEYAGTAADLRRVLESLTVDETRVQQLRLLAAERAAELFSWEAVAGAYEDLALRLVRHPAKMAAKGDGPTL